MGKRRLPGRSWARGNYRCMLWHRDRNRNRNQSVLASFYHHRGRREHRGVARERVFVGAVVFFRQPLRNTWSAIDSQEEMAVCKTSRLSFLPIDGLPEASRLLRAWGRTIPSKQAPHVSLCDSATLRLTMQSHLNARAREWARAYMR